MLAFDLGAESGRALLGLFDGQQLKLQIVHRFANVPVRVLDGMYWDVLSLHREMVHSLRLAASEFGGVDSIGVDTWGVDFALLGRNGELLGNPRHYRDPHTEGVMEATFARVPRAELYGRTGLQFMRFNSLFQLLAMQRDRSPLLDAATHLLFMPDLFHYFLTGIKVNEYTDASTSQLLNPQTRTWDHDLASKLGLPAQLLGTLVQPGTVLGPLRSSVSQETGLGGVPVVAPGTHDTASAVAAVPATGSSWAYISSGTWSLMGVETPAPVMTEKALAYNFTNEGGVGGTTRLLKNVMGLWLVQECRRAWERAGTSYSYEDLVRLASEAPPFAAIINPDDESFILPANMPDAIVAHCRRTGQKPPEGPGPIVRCALESLALRYRWVLEKAEELTSVPRETIHIVGGGCQNALLCQLTADACNRPVLAGPVEATAMGNLLVQAIGLKLLGSIAEGREVIARSLEGRSYAPVQAARWDEPYARFVKLLG
jgi:rhamnulokinase